MEQDFLDQKKSILKTDQKGQVALEFILVFAFALGVTFLFVKMSTNYTLGYIVHYATYMSSRTYLTFENSANKPEPSIASARTAASEVFESFPWNALGLRVTHKVVNLGSDAPSALFSGVTAQFEAPLTIFKVIGGDNTVNFYSESFLGKEPVRASCFQSVCHAMGEDDCAKEMDITMFDNGC